MLVWPLFFSKSRATRRKKKFFRPAGGADSWAPPGENFPVFCRVVQGGISNRAKAFFFLQISSRPPQKRGKKKKNGRGRCCHFGGPKRGIKGGGGAGKAMPRGKKSDVFRLARNPRGAEDFVCRMVFSFWSRRRGRPGARNKQFSGGGCSVTGPRGLFSPSVVGRAPEKTNRFREKKPEVSNWATWMADKKHEKQLPEGEGEGMDLGSLRLLSLGPSAGNKNKVYLYGHSRDPRAFPQKNRRSAGRVCFFCVWTLGEGGIVFKRTGQWYAPVGGKKDRPLPAFVHPRKGGGRSSREEKTGAHRFSSPLPAQWIPPKVLSEIHQKSYGTPGGRCH